MGNPPAFPLAARRYGEAMNRASLALCLLAALAACSKPDNAPGPGGVTVGEANALDEAAEMLDAQRLPEAAAQPAAPQQAPAATPTPQG